MRPHGIDSRAVERRESRLARAMIALLHILRRTHRTVVLTSGAYAAVLTRLSHGTLIDQLALDARPPREAQALVAMSSVVRVIRISRLAHPSVLAFVFRTELTLCVRGQLSVAA